MYRLSSKNYNKMLYLRFGLAQQLKINTTQCNYAAFSQNNELHQRLQHFASTTTFPLLPASALKTGMLTSSSAAYQLRRAQSSTTTNAEEALDGKKKIYKRKPRYSKYVELLEVTNDAVNERKSRVKRLQSKKLQDFITKSQAPPTAATAQPIEYQKINMEAFDASILEAGVYDDKPMIFVGTCNNSTLKMLQNERMPLILKSFHNYRDIIETIEHERHETDINLDNYSCTPGLMHEEPDPLESADPYVSPDVISTNRTVKTKTAKQRKVGASVTQKSKPRFKSKTHSSEENERLAKERALRINLNTYMSICVSTGLLNRGISTLLTYRQRARKNGINSMQNIISIDLYNILLHGLAENGHFERFNEIFQLIEEDGQKFNEQTYAAIFECLGRLEDGEENRSSIEQYIKQAQENGFTLHQIMDRAKFVADQRDIALDAIQRIHGDFVPIYTPPALGYNNALLQQLNEQIEPITDMQTPVEETKPSSIFNTKYGYSSAELQDFAREQLKVELEGRITITSIEKTKEFANAEYCVSP